MESLSPRHKRLERRRERVGGLGDTFDQHTLGQGLTLGKAPRTRAGHSLPCVFLAFSTSWGHFRSVLRSIYCFS